ncbi:hypothetical protein, variant 1 [Capsaspora owczarzaki ATCC 30864]|nr:hypothetical protein, variant 1 [Capsaspora owczarzaki ATCC 30864]
MYEPPPAAEKRLAEQIAKVQEYERMAVEQRAQLAAEEAAEAEATEEEASTADGDVGSLRSRGSVNDTDQGSSKQQDSGTQLDFDTERLETASEIPNTVRANAAVAGQLQAAISKKPRAIELCNLTHQTASLPISLAGLETTIATLVATQSSLPSHFSTYLTVPRLTGLVTLNLTNCGITDQTFAPVGASAAAAGDAPAMDLGIFQQMPALRRLVLCQNKLTAIPQCVLQCYTLHTLSLSYNSIYSFPANIDLMRNLICLSLNANLLTELHPSILRLRHLRSLSISNNLFATEPPEYKQLQNTVAILCIQGNPYLDPRGASLGGLAKFKQQLLLGGGQRTMNLSGLPAGAPLTRRLTTLVSEAPSDGGRGTRSGSLRTSANRASVAGDLGDYERRAGQLRRSSSTSVMGQHLANVAGIGQCTTVAEWLECLKLSNHLPGFTAQGFADLESLKNLNLEALTQIGVSSKIERMILLTQAEKLKSARPETPV